MDEKKYFHACLLIGLSIVLRCAASAKETEVRALVGTNAMLPCRVDVNQCGILHSVKWYRDSSRIYVFSQAGKFAQGEGDARERMSVTYNDAQNETHLHISNIKINDEATYKCEITYLEVGENCDVVQIVKLTTLVMPGPTVLTYNGQVVSPSSQLEEMDEGSEVELTCTSPGGKPIPTVSWYNGSSLMNRASYSSRSDENNGTGTGISKLQLTLSRGDLNARFECRVESQALDEPEISWVMVGVKVRPTGMKLSGVTGYVVQGTTVRLQCEVFSARPKADVRWYNGSDSPIETNYVRGVEVQERTTENGDGSYTTTSYLLFAAARWDDRRQFDCYGENEVMKRKGDLAMHELHILDVRYPPVITVSAVNTTVNESASVTMHCTFYANPQKLIGATWIKDGKNVTRVHGKHEHATVNNPTLRIDHITREDMGDYACWLKNEVGESVSEETIFLDVLYPPDVEIIMRPSDPVRAIERRNVTLECNVTSGNPPALRKVRWFLAGDLMTELPDCNYTISSNDSLGGPFCSGIDPSILSLIKVEQTFAGNYTCQGENEAGMGPVSEPKELIVYYPPSSARLDYYPLTVIKKGEVTLECSVSDPGIPPNVTYLWHRNGHLIHNVTVAKWKIPQASLETRSNFSCTAINEGGASIPDYRYINVVAPPEVIRTLNMNYMGVLYTSQNINLTCRIECYPLCSIIWLKDGHQLNTDNNNLYYVNVTEYPADYGKNDFESIESTLIWNMKNWPGQQLDKTVPNSNYTCASVSKARDRFRPDVNFTAEIAVYFPPEDLNVTKQIIDVEEYKTPERVKCSANGRPKLSFLWKNRTNPQLVKGDTLQLPLMTRQAATEPYTCEAWNKYGNSTIQVYFNVLYKPECVIEVGTREDNKALICKTDARPREVTFAWTVKEYNDTMDYTNFVNEGESSYIVLDTSIDTDRLYRCVANNSIGMGKICEIQIPGNTAPWYIGKENLIIIIASIITLIICVIIVCVVIIVLCKKKRQNTKSPNPSSVGDKMRLGAAPPVGGSADPANDHDKGFYENLPFHGMQNPPNKPYGPGVGDLEYADVDFKYGPINYKAASIYAAMKRNKNNNKLEEVTNGKNDDLL